MRTRAARRRHVLDSRRHGPGLAWLNNPATGERRSTTGLMLAPFGNGGVAGQTGFAGLALAWLVTTGVAIAAIRSGRVRRHREWMLRSYVVTLAFVWVRLILGLSILAGLDLQAAFGIAAWATWLVPLTAVQLLLARSATRVPHSHRTRIQRPNPLTVCTKYFNIQSTLQRR